MRTILALCGILAAFELGAYGAEAAPGGGERFRAEVRGIGYVEVALRTYGAGAKRSSWTTFQAEDAAHAKVLGSKRLADLLGFGDIQPVADAGLPGTVLVLDGAGFWLLGLEGARFLELFAPSKDALADLAKDRGADRWNPVPSRAYPRWLDGFDNAGPGIWWGGGAMPVDYPSEFPWMKERGMTFCFSPPTESRYVAPGVIDTTLTDWWTALAARHDTPFRMNLWDRTGNSNLTWLWNREPLPYVRAAAGRLPSTGRRFDEAGRSLFSIPYGCEPIPAVDSYRHDFRRKFMENMSRAPNFLGTKAVAEVPNAGIAGIADVAGMPSTKDHWHRYIQDVLGWDLAKVGLMHRGRRDFCRSWDQVEVPLPRDFLGLDGHSIDLAGAGWEGVADYDIKQMTMEEWDRNQGRENEYSIPGSPPSSRPAPQKGWVSVRSNEPLLMMYRGGLDEGRTKFADYWLRRGFTVTSEQAAGLKYLHLARPRNTHNKYCDVWLNGRPLKLVSKEEPQTESIAFSVDGALRAGENRILLRMEGRPPIDYIALGPLPKRTYPHMSGPENRLWFDAVNFSAWLRMRGVEETLQAMRAGDPNRQLKIMAPHGMYDLCIPLCERYGAYIHDTGGRGASWEPDMGRLAHSHGLPWSAEQAGPADKSAGFRGAITRYLTDGIDAVDLVFSVSAYGGAAYREDVLSDVNAWFDKNLNLIHCIGKMHLPTPPIAILRSQRVERLGCFSDQWRHGAIGGKILGAGRISTCVEVPDILDGTIDRFPVVMDYNAEVLDDAEVEGIRRYVERGGVFIAQSQTARHSPEQADAWPLAASLGLEVTPRWISYEKDSYHSWPQGRIVFATDQDLMPSLRGKEIFASGVAYAPVAGKAAGVRPVATWADDGSMAVVEARLGRGRIILLGSIFFRRMQDSNKRWANDDDCEKLLDEFLTSLGAPRETRGNGLLAERWRSKNGVYDVWKVVRMNENEEDAEPGAFDVQFRCETAARAMRELSALKHPPVAARYADGWLTLSGVRMEGMQTRVFGSPRAEIARAGLDWFKVQSKIWRALPPLPPEAKPAPIPVPEDVIPAAEGWRLAEGAAADTAWTAAGFDDAGWKPVKLGAFATLGLAEDSVNRFRTTIAIPAAWQGRRIELYFNAEGWFWGVIPEGRLWVDGEPAAVRQPLCAGAENNFTIDVTEQARDGKITLALEVDGRKPCYVNSERRERPAGVTGIFFLESTVPAVATTELAGTWSAAKDVNVLTPVGKGEKATFTYLETRFTLPRSWPGKRVFLERPDRAPIGYIVLNDQVIEVAPPHRLDIGGLVKRDGENVLRWMPDKKPEITDVKTATIPALNLVWTE